MKERTVVVFKEIKAFHQRLRKSVDGANDRNEDNEFFEKVIQSFAFFASCLNMVLQNDHEAHSL